MDIFKKNLGTSFIFLIVLIIFFFYDIIFLNRTLSTTSLLQSLNSNQTSSISKNVVNVPFSFDISGNAFVNEPNPYIVRRILDSSKIPTWNPFEGLGIPLIGNLNSEVFNPLKIFLNLYPHPYLQDIFFLLRLFVMGFLTYLFLIELKLSQLSSLFGAVFFMLSGYTMWWINLHPLSTVMYIPGVFYFYEKWSVKNDIISGFLASILLASSLIAGKTPEVIIGVFVFIFYAIWKGVIRKSFEENKKEESKALIITISGILLAFIVLLPFIELYIQASPIAKAIRTGASSHVLPLISSISFIQPLFLGLENYFYSSWLEMKQGIILPHSSIIVIALFIYSFLNWKTSIKITPFLIFSFFLIFVVYGIFPPYIISKIPVLRSIEYLKYNSMLYFSLSIISAYALNEFSLEKYSIKKFNISLLILSLIIIIFFYYLYNICPDNIRGYLLTVFISTIFVLICLFLIFNFLKESKVFSYIILLLLIVELFIYMPKGHPERIEPYKNNTIIKLIKNKPFDRIIGDGSSLPPLISNAFGFYDVRAVSVLLPGEYYTFFQNLVSFSIPYTNNPDPLFSITSPYIDLLGVRYLFSSKEIDINNLDATVRKHVAYLRWVRFFNSMINHSIKGEVNYGFFEKNGENKFSLTFSKKFIFRSKLKISEPFIIGSFIMKKYTPDIKGMVKVYINDMAYKLQLDGKEWKEIWLNVSGYIGKNINIKIEGDGNSEIVMNDFGLSPGYEKEIKLINNLLTMHKKEADSIEFKGIYNGIYVYENKNFMDRAFILKKIIKVDNISGVINKLQSGFNFRDIALVEASDIDFDFDMFFKENPSQENVQVVKYKPDEIILKVDTKGGLLVLSDLYYPGWKVKVNGKDEKIIKTFGILRGVLIKEGKNEVVFYYRPLSFYVGVVISFLTFTIWIIYLLKYKRFS